MVRHPDSLAHALARAQGGDWLPQEWQARRDQLAKGQRQVVTQRERLTDAYLRGILPIEEFEHCRRDLAQQEETLRRHVQELAAQGQQHQDMVGMVASMEQFCLQVQEGLEHATPDQQRELVELLVDRVIVTDGEVEIRYVIPISSRGGQTHFCHLHTDYLRRKSGQIDPPDERQIWRGRSPPPQPHLFRFTCLFREPFDLDQDQGPPHQWTRRTSPVAFVILWDGM